MCLQVNIENNIKYEFRSNIQELNALIEQTEKLFHKKYLKKHKHKTNAFTTIRKL